MSETTFENAKVGDRVWNICKGWATVTRIDFITSFKQMLCSAQFDKVNTLTEHFFVDGKEFTSDLNPSWFWDEVKIVAPERPKRLVKKEVVGWANFYPDRNRGYHDTESKALLYRTSNALGTGPVKMTGTLEVVE